MQSGLEIDFYSSQNLQLLLLLGGIQVVVPIMAMQLNCLNIATKSEVEGTVGIRARML